MDIIKAHQKRLALLLVFVIVICVASFGTCYGREGKHWRQRHHRSSRLIKRHGSRGRAYSHHHIKPDMNEADYLVSNEANVSLLGSKGGYTNTTFNVLDYGAKGDGKSDETKAFEAAWTAACKVTGSTIIVPSGSVFLVKPISFSGPNCAANIVFQLDGKIIAPTSSSAWGSGFLQWIEFTKLTKITIRGKGIIDGQGSVWWNKDSSFPRTKPTAVRFYGSSGVTVSGITIHNSPQTHLKFDDCTEVQVSGFTTSSPGDSPNTDGIHLQNSKNVLIYNTDLACGDDCVSIQTGCSNIYIHDVNCGPGHGISIGSLGKDNTKACVSNITVRDIKIQSTLTGVRIKTWQGGSGSVQDIMFANIQVSEVETPIMIDQFYCDGGKCKNDTSAVAVSGINYVNIQGTYTLQPVHFACSESVPCIGVSLSTIELKPIQERNHLSDPFCWETYGELKTMTDPPIDCLQGGKPPHYPSQLNTC